MSEQDVTDFRSPPEGILLADDVQDVPLGEAQPGVLAGDVGVPLRVVVEERPEADARLSDRPGRPPGAGHLDGGGGPHPRLGRDQLEGDGVLGLLQDLQHVVGRLALHRDPVHLDDFVADRD